MIRPSSFIYRDRHERVLEHLLIWWVGLLHDPDAPPAPPVKEFVCFEQDSELYLPYALVGSTTSLSRTDDCNIAVYFQDLREGTEILLRPEDTFIFDGEDTITVMRYYSICSAHQETDRDCPRCKVGFWHDTRNDGEVKKL